jgi:hypothetical protein
MGQTTTTDASTQYTIEYGHDASKRPWSTRNLHKNLKGTKDKCFTKIKYYMRNIYKDNVGIKDGDLQNMLIGCGLDVLDSRDYTKSINAHRKVIKNLCHFIIASDVSDDLHNIAGLITLVL